MIDDSELARNTEKKAAGRAAADMVEDGMVLGLGTGSTVDFFLRALAERIRDGLDVRGVPSSERTAMRCRDLGIELTDFKATDTFDLTIDGADEIDSAFQMIKGRGGALLREKIVAASAQKVVIIVDSTKLVDRLGSVAVPVEVVRFGHERVVRRLETQGVKCALRMAGDIPYTTENGHYYLDCDFGLIANPPAIQARLMATAGVVETGLFVGMCNVLIIGRGEETVVKRRGN